MRGTGSLLAIDLGTSGVKVGLFTAAGESLGFARRAYPLHRPPGRDGWAEQAPEEWWAAARDAARAVLAGRDPAALTAVCVGGQGPTLVLVDEQGAPVRPAISWLDARAEPERARLSGRLGCELTPFSLLPRLAWVARHEPAVLARARWALQAWDFLGFRLTGARVAVASAFRGNAVWPREWVAAAGLEASGILPRQVDAGQAYAETAGAWAAELGLPAGVRVVGGLDDGSGSVVGAAGGVVGRATDPGGTAGGLALCWDRPLAAPGVDCWPGFSPGTSIVGGAFAAVGRALDWWAGVAGDDLQAALARAAQAPVGSGGLVFLPFLAGERAPYWNPGARGAFLGLTLAHGPAHLARAVVESSGYALRLLAEAIAAAGGRIDELRVCGGQARSRFWNQTKADVTGHTVAVPRVTEVALMGDAIAAALGAGLYPDVVTAGEAMVRVAERLPPDPASRATYDELFGVYAAGHAALEPFFGPLHRAA